MSIQKRLKILAAIQTASRLRSWGTYTVQSVGDGAFLVIWEGGDARETAAIIEVDRERITWNADMTGHRELVRELGRLGMTEVSAGSRSPIFRAARAEVAR